MPDTSNYPIDQGWSWVIAIAGNILHILAIGTVRSAGVLLAAISETFDRNKQDTSWIMGLSMMVFCITLPFFMKLAEKIGVRKVVFVGGLVIAVSHAISFLAPNLEFLYFSMGILFGTGLGMVHGPTISLVSNYFDKKRTCAVGIVLSGASIGSFIIPPLVTYLCHEYTYRGCMLILAAMQLHICLCAAVMRPLSFYQKTDNIHVEEENNKLITNIIHENNSEDIKACQIQNCSSVCPSDLYAEKTIITKTSLFSSVHDIHICKREHNGKNEHEHPHYHELRKSKSVTHVNNKTPRPSYYRQDLHVMSPLQMQDISTLSMLGNLGGISMLPIITDLHNKSMLALAEQPTDPCINGEDQKITHSNKDPNKSKWQNLLADLALFKNPFFYTVTIPLAISTNSIIINFMVTPQHALDLGISATVSASLIQFQGISDLLVRLGVGLCADMIKCSKIYLIIVLTLCNGFVWLGIPLLVTAETANPFPGMLIFALMVGICGGGIITLVPVALVEVYGIKNLSITFGFIGIVEAVFLGAFPPILGRIKDQTGSWSLSLAVVGITCFICAAFLILDRLTHFFRHRHSATKGSDLIKQEDI